MMAARRHPCPCFTMHAIIYIQAGLRRISPRDPHASYTPAPLYLGLTRRARHSSPNLTSQGTAPPNSFHPLPAAPTDSQQLSECRGPTAWS